MQIDQKNEEDLFDKLLNLNHDIANIKKKQRRCKLICQLCWKWITRLQIYQKNYQWSSMICLLSYLNGKILFQKRFPKKSSLWNDRLIFICRIGQFWLRRIKGESTTKEMILSMHWFFKIKWQLQSTYLLLSLIYVQCLFNIAHISSWKCNNSFTRILIVFF